MTEDDMLKVRVAQSTTAILQQLQDGADVLANDFNLDNVAAYNLLFSELADHFKTKPDAAAIMDGRTVKWRCRFRIYDIGKGKDADPEADTDDGLPLDQPGTTIISGLPNVATEVALLARAFHQGRGDFRDADQLAGLSSVELERRLKSLRPTLSRRGGNATWRVPYDTISTFNEQAHKRGWEMRVDIQREGKTNEQ